MAPARPRPVALRPTAAWTSAALLILAWLAGIAPAAAQMRPAGTPIAICLRAVQPGDTVRAMLSVRTGFDCHEDQTRLGSGDFWARAASLPNTPGATRLRMSSMWQARATLWVAYADGALARIAIDDVGLARRIRLGAIVEQPLPVRAAPPVALLWRVEHAANLFAVVRGAHLATPAQSARSDTTLALLYGGFIGMCIALLAHNLAIWAVLRYRFQLAYCAMVAMLLIYAVSSSGLLAWVLPDLPNTARLRVNYLALGGAGAAALMFARCFFEAHVLSKWLDRSIPMVATLVVASAVAFAIFAPWRIVLLNRVYVIGFLLATLVAVPILWQAWRHRSRFLWLFAISWAAPVMLAALRVGGGLGIIRPSFLLDNSTLLALAVETLMSGLAIAYRIRLLSVERDAARASESIAREQADSDPLTGLANRRAFLRAAIGASHEQALLLADLDHFKRVNDTIGHDGGDEVLRIVARAMMRAAPTGAIVARLGGEEFAILAPADGGLSAPAILDAVRGEHMPFDVPVTISIGMCQGPLASEADRKSLYARADRALFAAKNAGRDRARYADRLVAA